MTTNIIGGLTNIIVMVTKIIGEVVIFTCVMGNGIGTIVGNTGSSVWMVHRQQLFGIANVPI